MSKARTLAGVVSTGAVLADGTVDASEIGSLTLPSGGDIVGTTAVQTLTNKTIDIASNTLTGVQATLVSGTSIKTINGGSVLGSGDLTVGGGAWIFLSEVVSSNSATVDIENTFDSTYDTYVIVVNGMLPSTDSALSRAQLKIGGSYQTSGYVGMYGNPSSQAANTFNSSISTVASPAEHITLSSAAGQTNETSGGSSFMFRIYDPSSTVVRKAVDYDGGSIARAANAYRQERLIGSARFDTNQSALTGVRFFYSTGNVATGTFRLYGINKS